MHGERIKKERKKEKKIKYLHQQSVILDRVPYELSHGQWLKFLKYLRTT